MLTNTPLVIERRAGLLAASWPRLAGPRLDRAVKIAQAPDTITELEPGKYQVTSQSNPLGAYVVMPAEKTCTCPDAGAGHMCKHRLAVALATSWLSREEEITFLQDLLNVAGAICTDAQYRLWESINAHHWLCDHHEAGKDPLRLWNSSEPFAGDLVAEMVKAGNAEVAADKALQAANADYLSIKSLLLQLLG